MVSNEFYHTGVAHDANPPGRGSGRYPYGSGENPGQHQFNLRSEVKRLEQAGYSQSEIAAMLLGDKGINKKTGKPIPYNSADLRAAMSMERAEQFKTNRARALELYDECHGNVSEVGRRMGLNESSVRSLLKDSLEERADRYAKTAEFLKKRLAETELGMIDISSGSELYIGVGEKIGVTDYTKKVAVAMLEKEGYMKVNVKIPTGPNQSTNMTVLAKIEEGETPSDTFKRVQQHKFDVSPIQDFTPDQGQTWWTPEFPESLDSSRVYIRYAEDGGTDKDGVIELRRGVEDISLGGSQYAQVRIAVDGTNYMKGMAIYGDDIPDGYDVVYNTNKHKGTPAIDKNAVYDPVKDSWSGKEVMKRMKINKETGEVDQDNPFGALLKSPKDIDGLVTAGGQRHYIGADGKDHLSPINKLRDEGDWDSWSRTLSSQFLSKQPLKLIKQQTDLSIKDKELELEKIKSLTNPVIKKKLLEEYADNCDANAADLSVRGFKNQAYQVLLPVPKMKENEIYAPNYKDGDTVALVRYPHGGTFEIPVLTVNNKSNSFAKQIMENAKDAVGIHPRVAEQLSGADFDGDTALVIPLKSNKLGVYHQEPLKGLKGFDPKELYKLPDQAPVIKNKTKQKEMGVVTNLITDMTVGGARNEEIVRAVKHSMVVIDSEKHHLDYKRSAVENDISSLKVKYQKNETTGKIGGASTILSRAKASERIPLRKEITNTKIMTSSELADWNAGKKVYRNTGETTTKLIKKTSSMTDDELERYNAGKKVFRKTSTLKTMEVHQMDVHDDAMELVRDPKNQKEVAYAEYANHLKSLARSARQESRSIKTVPVSKEARQTYAAEVESLNSKLRIATSNTPKERRAQALANAYVSEKLKSNPNMDFEHRKREQSLALTRARASVGAKKEPINITDREWEAIQSNAISTNKLRSILDNTNQDKFRQRATPRRSTSLSNAEIAKARAMLRSGMYTNKEIADSLGVSVSTVSRALA